MIRKAMLVLVAGSIVLAAAACNTIKGAGKDLESASDATKGAINGK